MSDKKKTVNPGATNPGKQAHRVRADGIPESITDAFTLTQRSNQGVIEAPLSLKEMLERNKRAGG